MLKKVFWYSLQINQYITYVSYSKHNIVGIIVFMFLCKAQTTPLDLELMWNVFDFIEQQAHTTLGGGKCMKGPDDRGSQ